MAALQFRMQRDRKLQKPRAVRLMSINTSKDSSVPSVCFLRNGVKVDTPKVVLGVVGEHAYPMNRHMIAEVSSNRANGYTGFMVRDSHTREFTFVPKDADGKWRTALRDCAPPDELPK